MPAAPRTATLTIPVTPLGKPRMTQRDRWAKRPAVERYWALADALRDHAEGFPRSKALELHFVFPTPKSWTKKKTRELLGQPHEQRPDLDNAVKAVLDALYEEDGIVHTIHARKTWGETGSITIATLEEPA